MISYQLIWLMAWAIIIKTTRISFIQKLQLNSKHLTSFDNIYPSVPTPTVTEHSPNRASPMAENINPMHIFRV